MAELSVIIPFVREWPTIVFTVRNIAEELRDRVDFEIITVDNFCKQVEDQIEGVTNDRAGDQLKGVMRGHKWLKAIDYKDRLSHWQAKNAAVKVSTGKFLYFCDSHCIISRDSLFNMFNYYKEHHEEMQGTIHLPLTYHIMEYHQLVYKLVADLPAGNMHYSFTPYRPPSKNPIYEVPCMSACGVLISRELYNSTGGWPTELGIYGGGENFLNFTLSVLGKKKYIFTNPPLCHHGDNRGYHWYGDDYTRNRCIATYIFGGKEFALRFMQNRKGDQRALMDIYNNVIERCKTHRELIKSKQIISIEDWIKKWK